MQTRDCDECNIQGCDEESAICNCAPQKEEEKLWEVKEAKNIQNKSSAPMRIADVTVRKVHNNKRNIQWAPLRRVR